MVASVEPLAVSPAAFAHSDQAAHGQDAPEGFASLFKAAEAKLRASSEKLVASALLLPLLNRMQSDPFRSDLFNGGMAEDSFRSMLNTQLADDVVHRSDFGITERVHEPMARWLRSQPPETLQRIAKMRIDTLG